MNTNGPKPSREPRHDDSDQTKPYSSNDPSRPLNNPNQRSNLSTSQHNDPNASQPNPRESAPWPHANEAEQLHKQEPKTSFQESTSSREPYSHEAKDKNYQRKSTMEQTEDKLKDTFKNIKDSKKLDELYNYAATNKERTIAYILLAVGILFLFISPLFGGLVIGMVTGYYYSREIVFFIRHSPRFLEGQNQLRYIVLIALLIGLLLAAPGIVIGAAIVAAFKQIINRNERPDIRENEPKMNRPNDKGEGNPRNGNNKGR